MEFAQLKLRLITAGVLVGCGLASGISAAYYPESAWTMTGLAFIGVGMSSAEFSRMSASEARDWVGTWNLFLLLFVPGLVLCALAIRTITTQSEIDFLGQFFFVIWLTLLVGLALALHSGRHLLERAVTMLRDVFVGYLLVVFGGCSVIYLTALDRAPYILLWLLLVVCLNDAAAYFVGSKIGGIRIAPTISPRKTVAGCIAGIVVGTAVGTLSRGLLPGSLSPSYAVLFCSALIISAQLGDFLKSLVKRSYGVKDSGSILPGHGGILDRIDGVLMAAPPLLGYCLLMYVS